MASANGRASRPPGALSPRQAAFVAGLIRVYSRDGRATIRSVMDECGYRSIGNLERTARQLRDLGLVDFEDKRAGTLRPVYWPTKEQPNRG